MLAIALYVRVKHFTVVWLCCAESLLRRFVHEATLPEIIPAIEFILAQARLCVRTTLPVG